MEQNCRNCEYSYKNPRYPNYDTFEFLCVRKEGCFFKTSKTLDKVVAGCKLDDEEDDAPEYLKSFRQCCGD